MTIIKIRKGLNGHKYSACDKDGYFIGNFDRLADIRKHWRIEIRYKQVELVRELDKEPDMSKIEATHKAIDAILRSYAEERRCKRCKA